MEGKTYNKQTTKGKILVLKCWFIDCRPCIAEMPALNELKQQYKNRNDILFVSICWDSKKDVEAFLKKPTFNYAVVPDQYKFLTEGLQLNGYPTHFVINKQGFITKKVNDYRGMAYALKKESLK
jgi:thiol-disulfide isomerase/thioredoxin